MCRWNCCKKQKAWGQALQLAIETDADSISCRPDWLTETLFNINAKQEMKMVIHDAAPATEADLPAEVQSLIAYRNSESEHSEIPHSVWPLVEETKR